MILEDGSQALCRSKQFVYGEIIDIVVTHIHVLGIVLICVNLIYSMSIAHGVYGIVTFKHSIIILNVLHTRDLSKNKN